MMERVSTIALGSYGEPSKEAAPAIPIIGIGKNEIIQKALEPGGMVLDLIPADMINLLKYNLNLANEKYQKETGHKFSRNEWEAQLKANLRGMLFERLSALDPVNSINNKLAFTTMTEEDLISVSVMQTLQKATLHYPTKTKLIDSFTKDKDKLKANTVIPDHVLAGPNNEITGLVEDKGWTSDEVKGLAEKLENDPATFLQNLDKEIAFLKLVTDVRENELGINKPTQQPVLTRSNAIIVLRFPADTPIESLRRIGVVLAENGYQIEIQTLPFTSAEVDDIGKELLKENAAMIHYSAGNLTFPKKEIEFVESYAGIAEEDVERNLIKVTEKDVSPEGIKILNRLTNPVE